MATTLFTRIKNKVDTLSAWQSYTGTLLNGEIAVVRVPTGGTYTNPVTGADEPVVELLMKVGDGSTAFANLPWMSAKASDVYDWAKAATVVFNTTNDNKYHLEFRDAGNNVIAYANLEDINARLAALEEKKITVTPSDNSKPGVVQSVAQGDASHEIDVTYGLIKTVDIDDKQVTAAKIADSTITVTQLANNAVETAKINDGAVTNAKLGNDISTDKINVGTSSATGTLSKKLAEVDTALANIKTNFSVDPASATTDGVVQGITYDNTNGKFTVSYGTVATNDIANDAVTTDKIKDANVTEAKLASNSVTTEKIKDANVTDAKIAAGISSDKITIKDTTDTLTTKLGAIDASISGLSETLAKGIIFRGEVSTTPTGTTYTLKNTTTAVNAVLGDMVLCGEKEYVYVAERDWKELGDLSRVTTLETWRNNLQIADIAETNKFVTKVAIATDGTVAIERAQPTSENITHVAGESSTTVSAKLGDIDGQLANIYTKDEVYTQEETDNAITNAISELDFNDPTATDDTSNPITFIDTVSQTDGEILATKKTIRSATTSVSGIVKLNDSLTSTSTTEAATANAVKTAYDKGAEGVAAAAAISANYVKVTNGKLVNQAGDVIIFDCGGASDIIPVNSGADEPQEPQ